MCSIFKFELSLSCNNTSPCETLQAVVWLYRNYFDFSIHESLGEAWKHSLSAYGPFLCAAQMCDVGNKQGVRFLFHTPMLKWFVKLRFWFVIYIFIRNVILKHLCRCLSHEPSLMALAPTSLL